MSNSKLGIIVQARMGSTRLPGKVLKKVGDRPLLQHIFDRAKKIKLAHQLVVATSNLEKDDVLETFCQKHDTQIFRGDESNVLNRYYECAKKYSFDHIVRLTADNPFFDYDELDWLVECHFKNKAQYSNNFKYLPIGVGMEVMSFDALEKSIEEGHENHHLEHVNEYILENPQIFKSILVKPKNVDKINSMIRMTVDTQEDLDRANLIFELTGGDVTTLKIVSILKQDFGS